MNLTFVVDWGLVTRDLRQQRVIGKPKFLGFKVCEIEQIESANLHRQSLGVKL